MEGTDHPLLLNIRIKDGDNIEKIRKRVIRRLKKVEKTGDKGSMTREIDGLTSSSVKAVVSNTYCIAFLLTSGRVCRVACSSQPQVANKYKVTEDAGNKSRQTSFQVLSDAEYARQLQLQFDQERYTNRRGRLATNEPPSYDYLDLNAMRRNTLNTNFSFSSFEGSTPVSTDATLPGSLATSSDTPLPVTTAPTTTTVPALFQTLSGDGGFTKVTSEEGKERNEGEEVWPSMTEVEYLTVKTNPDVQDSEVQFSCISALHSEILLVESSTRQLYRWSCDEGGVAQPHPLIDELGLRHERIQLLSSSEIRASVLTESGRIATFYDPLLRGCSEAGVPPLISSLSHPVLAFSEFSNEHVLSLHVSDFMSVATTTEGKVYWWGLCPQLKTTPTATDAPGGGAQHKAINDGSLVRLKDGPPCGPNALVLQCSKTHGPRVGKTVNIIEHGSLDPTTSVLVKVLKQKEGEESMEIVHSEKIIDNSSSKFDGLEVWSQSEVVFLDDSPAVLGRVIAIDNHQAIVDISYAHTSQGPDSKTQSSLRVFRVQELEPCVDIDLNISQDNVGGASSQLITRSLSRHVAGVVQHHPVCIVDPTPGHTSQLSIIDDGFEPNTPLVGFRPLAVHVTSTGPYLCVKRVSDNKTFIVCSSRTNSGMLQTSSYVAVEGQDQKPSKSTIEEEGCCSVECGLEWEGTKGAKEEVPLIIEPGGRGKRPGKRRKRKLAQRDTTLDSATPPSCHSTASFVDLYNSEVLFLQDIHGILNPIPSGLKLKPDDFESRDHAVGWSPFAEGNDIVLSSSYKCVLSRQYVVAMGKRKCLIVVLVPRKTTLLPPILSGDCEGVKWLLDQLVSQHPPSKEATDVEATPTKRSNVNKELSLENGTEPGTSRTEPGTGKTEPGTDIEMECCSGQDHAYGLSPLSKDILYEATAHNNNVLHVCCASREHEERQKQGFVPFQVDNLVYQSISLQPEYRHISFEELHYKNRNKGYNNNNKEEKKDPEELNTAHLNILDSFLSCTALQSDIIKLLCQKNAYGETPFMTATAHQNFTAALKILTFVDNQGGESLLQNAILSWNREGMTPVQVFLSSYGSCYDSRGMRLYVSSLPMGYTAQQLLQLFRECYPSVYRAEITKDVENTVEEGGAIDSSDDSDVGLPSNTPLLGLGLAQRSNPRTRTGQNTTLGDNNVPLRGVVYFSNLNQLRAAHAEMQDFRVFSNYNSSRGGSFGQTHSVSFLNVGLEPDECLDYDGEAGEGGLPSLMDVGHGIVSRVTPNRRARAMRGNNGRSLDSQAKHEARSKKASLKLREASKLLCTFLSRPEIISAQDVHGESVMESLVHNPRCMDSMKDSYIPYKPRTSPKPTPVVTATCKPSETVMSSFFSGQKITLPVNEPIDVVTVTSSSVPTPLSTLLGSEAQSLGTTGMGIFGTSLTTEGSPNVTTPTLPVSITTPILDTPTSQPVPSASKLWRPYSSSEEQDGTGTSLADTGTSLLSTGTSLADMGTSLADTGTGLVSTGTSLAESQSTGTSLADPGTGTSLVSEPNSVLTSVITTVSDIDNKVSVVASNKVAKLFSNSPTIATPPPQSTPGEETKSLENGVESKEAELESAEEAPNKEVTPEEKKEKKKCSTCDFAEIMYLGGADFLYTLFSNWPCIVITILGYNPLAPSKTPPPNLSQVHALDSFVQRLYANGDIAIMLRLNSCIVRHINESIEKGQDISAVDLNHPENITEDTLALYVGMRFLRAVVRILALEHSRVKGAISEVPTSREGRARNQQYQNQSRILMDMIKTTLDSFSWLSVDIMAESANTASLPVCLGVSKPFGASSVTSDYQSGRLSSSLRFAADRSLNKSRSLVRQLHIRTALPATDGSNVKVLPTPPISGLKLIPQRRGNHSDNKDGNYQDDFGIDLSDSDVPASETGNDSFEARTTQGTNSYSTPTQEILGPRAYSPTYSPSYEIMLDSSSDEDDPFGDVVGGGMGRRGNQHHRGEGVGDIYPFAWALDGRRIGENTPVVRPQSPTSSFFAHGEVTPLCTIPSIRFGAGFLARTFARIVKDLVDVAVNVTRHRKYNISRPSVQLTDQQADKLILSTVNTLEKTWTWLTTILDVAEGQLRQGKNFDTQRFVATLRGSVRPASPSNSSSVVQRIITRTASKSFIGSTPGEYITFLLRSQSNENNDCLPVVDLYGYEHVVYILDALLYALNKWPHEGLSTFNKPEEPMEVTKEEESTKETEEDQPEEEYDPLAPTKEEIQKINAKFFGTTPTSPGPFGDPLQQEAFPLAKQPHLLKPDARKEHLFQSPRGSMEREATSQETEPMEALPLSYSHIDPNRVMPHPLTLNWTLDGALERWNTSISVFAHIFLAEGPGSERANFLNTRAGFASRMARFRHQVSQLYESTQGGRGDWASVSNSLSLRLRRDHLLEDSLEYISHLTKFHYSQIRVKFEGEDGSGPGVNRGFFASLANSIKTSDMSLAPCSRIGALFFQPGKEPEQSGLYSPQPFIFPTGNSVAKNSTLVSDRASVFRAIGRFLGFCFWFKHTIPFMVCRHVAKFLLDRELAWHDLAFYNADLYEGLRRMMMDGQNSKSKEEFQATYCCYFEAPVSGQKLTGQGHEPVYMDLINGGSKIPVTPERVQEYVRLYAMFVMVGSVRDELQAMKDGLQDVIPPELLHGLTAEDFQLLLSGDSASISVQRLKAVMKFNHTHGKSQNICDRFEKMFWRVVSHMNNTQRQQLLYFATGSAALPSVSDQEPAALAITIDVIGGSNIEALPVASTCSQRMSIPLYPSYHALKKKLLQAVQCQAYGLG